MPNSSNSSRRSSHAGLHARRSSRHSLAIEASGGNGKADGTAREKDEAQKGARTAADLSYAGHTNQKHQLGDACRSPILGPNSPRLELVSYEAHSTGLVTDINIAVIGNTSVGKSSFIRRVLRLDDKVPSQTAPTRTLSIAGNTCLVRMFEMAIEDVFQDEDEALCWPAGIHIHAVTTLYDVGNKLSFKTVPQVLNSINTMNLPSILTASKCDLDQSLWQVDPKAIGRKASSAFQRMIVLQISESVPETSHKALSTIIRAALDRQVTVKENTAAGHRRQTLPILAGLPASPRQTTITHARSTSELPALKARQGSVVGSSTDNKNWPDGASNYTSFSSNRLSEMPSFLLAESTTESASSRTSTSLYETELSESEREQPLAISQTIAEETGISFDALVDRLLALPLDKSDHKFPGFFLALYRKFAAPGQLLESIVVRFEGLNKSEPAYMLRAVGQLRHLTVLVRWLHSYPGDFAHSHTLRRIKTFIGKIEKDRLFAKAAQMMTQDLECVVENDDTGWACNDENRNTSSVRAEDEWSYNGSLFLDDPTYDSEIGGQHSRDGNKTDDRTLHSHSSKDSRHKRKVERVPGASNLVPTPCLTLSKSLWRTLLNTPDEDIAREMTITDWALFSSLQPRDLVRHVSLAAEQKAQCKDLIKVGRMIDNFNYVRDWVINFILLREKPKHRTIMLAKMMQVARKVRDLNNYNSLGAILAGVHSTPVQRLQLTKELIPSDVNKDWMKLEILMSHTRSFTSYRLAWDNSSGQRIPYLPLPIRDLVGAQSGNKTFVGDPQNARINWRKFEVMGHILAGIERAQQVPYNLGPCNDDVRALILQAKIIRDDDTLYERSVQLEAHGASEKRGLKDIFKR